MAKKEMHSDKIRPIFTKNFLLITAINLFVFFSFQMIFPILPLYIKKLGGSDSVIGLVMSAFVATSLLTRPFAGLALDKIGRRPVFVMGLIILGMSAMAYSFVSSLVLMLYIRLLHGFGWGIAGTATSTVAAEIIPRERFGEGIGYFSMANSLSLAIAPACGLYIVNKFGFNNVFGLATVLVCIGLVLAFFIRFRKFIPSVKHEPLYERKAYGPAVLMCFISASMGGITGFLPLYALQLGVSQVGLFFTVYAMAVFISRPLSGKIVDKHGYDITIISGFAASAVGLIIIANVSDLTGLLIASFVFGVGFGTSQMSLQTMVVKSVSRERLGAANATFFSGMDLGTGLGALALGNIAELTGYSSMYMASSYSIFIALLVYLLYVRKQKFYNPKQAEVS